MMKPMHVQMARLYEAARAAKRLSGTADQRELAELLNVAPQNVNNWESRGPSKEAMLQAQFSYDVNATWVATGKGPMFVGGAAPSDSLWPFHRVDIRRVLRLDPLERSFVEGKLESAIETAEARVGAVKSGGAAA
ncbi:helix-turn-helix domain-containing protein [Bordetella ansorpii]|uniref:helix-turn-helix domain-containing protein n=1 Tax=Bordetella ansorpii TaxID=288768 RepID=UPI0009EE5CA6|nr:helix-turn-helix domain-containing protein [Bordetella ansorpii]